MFRIFNFVLIHTSTFIQRDPSFQVEIRTLYLSHSSFLKDQTQKSWFTKYFISILKMYYILFTAFAFPQNLKYFVIPWCWFYLFSVDTYWFQCDKSRNFHLKSHIQTRNVISRLSIFNELTSRFGIHGKNQVEINHFCHLFIKHFSMVWQAEMILSPPKFLVLFHHDPLHIFLWD